MKAYLRLVGQERVEWQGRSHFLAMAATSMRRILVDRARKKRAEKHGGGGEKIQLEEALVFSPQKSKDIVALDVGRCDHYVRRDREIGPSSSRYSDNRGFGRTRFCYTPFVVGLGIGKLVAVR